MTGKRTISSSCVLFVVCVPVVCLASDPRLISLAATVEHLTFPSGEGGRRKAEAEESSSSFGLRSQRKRQKVKNVPTLKVTKA